MPDTKGCRTPLYVLRGAGEEYPANVVLLEVLRSLGAATVTSPSEVRSNSTLVVTYPAHKDVVRSRLATIGRRVKVIAVPLVLLHDSRIGDRKEGGRLSFRSVTYRTADLALGRLSNLIVADTSTHAEWMEQRLRRGVVSASLGSAIELLAPDLIGTGPPPWNGTLELIHYGNGFPIQGIQTVLEAVGAYQDIVHLRLIGRRAHDLRVPPNVSVLKPLAAPDLYRALSTSHAMLGQFGATPQQSRVVPNKIYDAFALGLPVLTGHNTELERLTDGDHLMLTTPGSTEALIDAISRLNRFAGAGELPSLGRAAHETYISSMSMTVCADEWSQILTNAFSREHSVQAWRG